MKPLHELTGVEAAQAIAAGTITSEALVTACLERITGARRERSRLGISRSRGSTGPGAARDHSPAQGPCMACQLASRTLSTLLTCPPAMARRSTQDTDRPGTQPVRALRAAGAVILGKTVTTEFAMFTPGKTANPHNAAHTPGGSSSGSAAAVADKMVPLALGTQTAGSIIRPASFCGVVGYKPTHGQFPVAGIKALSQTLDTLGGFARSVADFALLRAVLVGGPVQLPS